MKSHLYNLLDAVDQEYRLSQPGDHFEFGNLFDRKWSEERKLNYLVHPEDQFSLSSRLTKSRFKCQVLIFIGNQVKD
jgi:hypothetical protein